MTKAVAAYSRKLSPGQRFHRLTAIAPAGHEPYGRRKLLWRFQCDCGDELIARSESVKSGNTKSCGCLKLETSAENGRANVTHGLEGTRIYRIWIAMLNRCENPSNFRFEYYGARGVKVCKAWHDINAFRKWALENGYADNLTIDRYPDKDGNYEPSNCRWATWRQQALNRRPKRWYRRE
jgi:hypothetical protein